MTIFLSSGVDPYEHLRRHTVSAPAAGFEGAWATIELQPDAFGRQRYVVGVAVIGLNGRFNFRLLDDLSTFDCIYGRDEVAAIRDLMADAERGLIRARDASSLHDIHFETPAVFLGDQWPTSGASLDAVLNRLFIDSVPFIPRDVRKAKDFVTVDNAGARHMVNEALKRIGGMAFERISLAGETVVRDMDSGEAHTLDVNLGPDGKAGSVISAVYKTPTNVELNFLRASRDIATYARMKDMQDGAKGLFILIPSKGVLPGSDFDRMEGMLAEQSWRLEKQGFVVSAHDTPAALANDILGWADLTS